MGGDIPKEDDYWEAELEIKGANEPITVLINRKNGFELKFNHIQAELITRQIRHKVDICNILYRILYYKSTGYNYKDMACFVLNFTIVSQII